MRVGLCAGKQAWSRQATLWKCVFPRTSYPCDSWMCPKMCSFGSILSTASRSRLQPTLAPGQTGLQMASRMPKGGWWVTRTSTFSGRLPQTPSASACLQVNPISQSASVQGEPKIRRPSTSTQSWIRKVQTSLSFWISCSGTTFSFSFTFQMWLAFSQTSKEASPKSWLPGITILCLQGSALRKALNFSNYLRREQRVKSPAWIKISASGQSAASRCFCLSWVSDMATMRIFRRTTSSSMTIKIFYKRKQTLPMISISRILVPSKTPQRPRLLAAGDNWGWLIGQLIKYQNNIILSHMSESKSKLTQCFGRKKNSVAVASVRAGKGVLRVNGSPIELLEPQSLRAKVLEPILLLGLKRFQDLDIRIRVRGGGYVSQIYAIRQALSKGVVAYYQKYVNETEKRQIKELLLQYDRSLLVADPRRCEPKKYGGPGARARYQKSYR